jgi:hypothetical protein
MTTRPLRTVAAALLLAVAGACGGGTSEAGDDVASLDDAGASVTTTDSSTPDAADAPADPEEAMLAFAECMREHGVDMPDPQTDGGGGGVIDITGDADDATFQDAQEACEPLMENAMGDIEIDPEQQAEMEEQMLAFAECMREHGVDMPDPVFGSDGRVTVNGGPGPEVESDEFEAAAEECGQDGGMVLHAAPAGGG